MKNVFVLTGVYSDRTGMDVIGVFASELDASIAKEFIEKAEPGKSIAYWEVPFYSIEKSSSK
jgi:hypothetical protein